MRPLRAAILIYALLLLRWGYLFGYDDQIEFLPYALWLRDHTALPGDFFLSQIKDIFPNERLGIALLFAWLPDVIWPLWALLLHASTTLLLLLGLHRIARFWLPNGWAWLPVLLPLIPFYLKAAGMNDLYYNNIQGESVAWALSAWAIVLAIQANPGAALWLGVAATLFHPIAGLLVSLVIAGTFILNFSQLRERKGNALLLLPFGLILLWPLLIKLAYDQTARPDPDYYTLIFEWRNAHHYLPWKFPIAAWFVSLTSLALTLLLAWRTRGEGHGHWLLHATGLIIIGMTVYSVGVALRIPAVTSLQAFKLMPWVKFWGMICAVGWMKKAWENMPRPAFLPAAFWQNNLRDGLLLLLAISLPLHLFIWPVPMDIPYYTESWETDICSQMRASLPPDAVVVHPPGFTEVAWYARRGSFVSWKANLKQPGAASDWAARIKAVYGWDWRTGKPEAGDPRVWMPASDPATLRAMGATHVVMPMLSPVSLPLVVGNRQYSVYSLYEPSATPSVSGQ